MVPEAAYEPITDHLSLRKERMYFVEMESENCISMEDRSYRLADNNNITSRASASPTKSSQISIFLLILHLYSEFLVKENDFEKKIIIISLSLLECRVIRNQCANHEHQKHESSQLISLNDMFLFIAF